MLVVGDCNGGNYMVSSIESQYFNLFASQKGGGVESTPLYYFA